MPSSDHRGRRSPRPSLPRRSLHSARRAAPLGLVPRTSRVTSRVTRPGALARALPRLSRRRGVRPRRLASSPARICPRCPRGRAVLIARLSPWRRRRRRRRRSTRRSRPCTARTRRGGARRTTFWSRTPPPPRRGRRRSTSSPPRTPPCATSARTSCTASARRISRRCPPRTAARSWTRARTPSTDSRLGGPSAS